MWSTLAIHVLCTTLLAQACAEGPHHAWAVGKAVYLQSNEQHNSVISIPIGKDGKLHGGVVTATGGAGGDSIDGSTNAPASPDALSSQGSVVVSDDVSCYTFTS
ncbi:uncharacterized protein N7459_005008 [Penicillium hispanicum]|uniref:uncharacterized protein n=1 Tax=Penicillium hispanicum TaxID=1080232 RepID=UPI002540876A|nr:uncharacterized protein N7459_005008 [Penicillium hispanicum]KAJ5585208.1 hypothetical protein N7459_005008 [Penicillium hispanicum]